MNRLSLDKQTQIVRSLVKGNSISATVRMTDASKNTIAKLLLELGAACAAYQDDHLRNLDARNVQCDEIWSFVGMKEKNVPEDKQGEFGFGDVWTWVAMDTDSKLVLCWNVGMRDAESGCQFMKDVASRLRNRVQMTTDGHRVYLRAIMDAFGFDIDYAMLVKVYGNDTSYEKRYSPAVCLSASKTPITGKPDLKRATTSHVERQNLTMRMCRRRFTRLTNGFSKKLENHCAAIALHYMYYNFVRVHQMLKTTPAVAAGVTDHVWPLEKLVALISN